MIKCISFVKDSVLMSQLLQTGFDTETITTAKCADKESNIFEQHFISVYRKIDSKLMFSDNRFEIIFDQSFLKKYHSLFNLDIGVQADRLYLDWPHYKMNTIRYIYLFKPCQDFSTIFYKINIENEKDFMSVKESEIFSYVLMAVIKYLSINGSSLTIGRKYFKFIKNLQKKAKKAQKDAELENSL